MAQYIITNNTTKENETVWSTDSKAAKAVVCRERGWDSAKCDIRRITQ